MTECRLIADTRDQLGEGPVFVARENALRWVDIFGKSWHRFDLGSGALRSIELPEGLTAYAPRRAGGFVGTFESGFALLSEDATDMSWLHRPEMALADNRFNDGGTDPRGRFLACSGFTAVNTTRPCPDGSAMRSRQASMRSRLETSPLSSLALRPARVSRGRKAVVID